MLRLENIPPEQMPEVVRIASELYSQDQTQDAEAQERQATVDAAAEIGLPEAYLHRAVTELHTRRVEQIRQRRRHRIGLLAIGGAVLVLGSGAAIVSRIHASSPTTSQVKAPASTVAPAFTAGAWQLNTNRDTQATVNFVNNTAVLQVQRFVADRSNHFTANFNNLDGSKNLVGLHTITFRMHGTLPHVRLYLENGSERWRSPELTVEGQERLVHIDLSQFERQTRGGAESTWQKSAYQPPEWVENLSFKTGWYVNQVQASGEVMLSDLRFE